MRQAIIQLNDDLTHWGRVTHICVGNLTTIGPDNGLSPGRRQTIISTNAWILLIGPCGTNFSEILIGIHTFSFKKIHLKMSSAKFRPYCFGLNVFIQWSVSASPGLNNNILIPWKIASTLQTTFSNSFSGMKVVWFWFGIHWSWLLWAHFKIYRHEIRLGV